ncbi:MAG: TIGR00304 family membrane protein [Candidatus Thorarchaeota archaeon]|jgi:uncharacterized protein (TIGR00304 family)
MQVGGFYFFLGITMFFVGLILVILALFFTGQQRPLTDENGKSETRGVILIGPIPIVWGFGSRGRQIATALCLIVILSWVILILF